MATEPPSPTTLAASFAPWRHLHVSQAELRARIEALRGLEASGQLDEAVARAEAMLEHAPFDAELLRWLVRACAARGDVEAHARHLATACYVDVLDPEAAREDASLRGRLSAEAFANNLRDARAGIGKDRSRDFKLTEIEPRSTTFCTRLRWRAEDSPAVLAALRRFCADTSRVDRARDPKQAWVDDYLWWIERSVGDGTQLDLEGEFAPGFCHLGRIVVLLQELAPFVDDVRTLIYDQTSPLYEVWIVDRACYVRRHAICADDEVWQHLDTLIERANIRDPVLEARLVEHFTTQAAEWLAAASSTYLDAADCKQRSEALLARAARLGAAPPPLMQAKQALRDGDEARALEALERAAQDPANPQARLALLDYLLARDRFLDALRVLPATEGAGPHRWGVAYEGGGFLDEARAAYQAHARGMLDGARGVLLRDADGLFDRGWFESARAYYAVLAKTTELSTPIRAELGLARCAERRGAADEAEAHYRQVLVRAPAQRRKYADSPAIVAAIEHCEHAAVRWRDAHERRDGGGRTR